MTSTNSTNLMIKAGGHELEYRLLPPAFAEAPTFIFLHEGLGCVEMWRDFPGKLAAATGFGALVYSRAGYGNSAPVSLPRSVRFMHDEALKTLPELLDAFTIPKAILFGHSDGGSIALIHAGGISNSRISGLILEAPHVFVEEFGLKRIRAAAIEYEQGDLKAKLARYHGRNVAVAFWGWNDVWLRPEFRDWNIEEYLPNISVPVLVIQGEDDQYGTWNQVEAIQQGCAGKVETVRLSHCGHSPHRDQLELTLKSTIDFLHKAGIA